ncbi:protein of unknown function DUF323, partial [Reticulomyxa filosa]
IGSTDQPYWKKAPGNTNLEYFTSECPIDMFPCPNSGGFYDIIGNVWQHTLTPQHPFEGFAVHKWYEDFTVPCFGPHHSMLKGGSWISTGNEAIALSRYQFRRHFFQHAGIRYIDDTNDTVVNDDKSPVGRNLSYLQTLADTTLYTNLEADMSAHSNFWDEKYLGVPNLMMVRMFNFSHLICWLLLFIKLYCYNETYNNNSKKCIHTARLFGVDSSPRRRQFAICIVFVYGCNTKDTFDIVVAFFFFYVNAIVTKKFRVTVNELGYKNILNKVVLVQNDVQNMDPEHKDFDLIVATNLLDRLNDPLLFLSSIHQRINKGGTFVLLSSYSWNPNVTPKSKWIGGKHNERGEV